MRRREFLALAGAAVALPRFALAQQAAKVWRIAELNDGGLPDDQRQALLAGLADYGYIEGKNLFFEWFNAPSLLDLPDYAARAVASSPDLIITSHSPPALAVKALTTTIPVVVTALQDPVAIGAVASYARPGGNITGFMQGGPQYAGKQIELIHEVLPTVTRVADLGVPADPVYAAMIGQKVAAATALNMELIAIGANVGDDLAQLLDRAAKSGAQAIQFSPAAYFSGANTAVIAQLAIDRRLPAFYSSPAGVATGFLLGYGADIVNLGRQTMAYVDAILKGAKPADLPIQQPAAFELAINMKTARAFGITFPPSILLRATQVIE